MAARGEGTKKTAANAAGGRTSDAASQPREYSQPSQRQKRTKDALRAKR